MRRTKSYMTFICSDDGWLLNTMIHDYRYTRDGELWDVSSCKFMMLMLNYLMSSLWFIRLQLLQSLYFAIYFKYFVLMIYGELVIKRVNIKTKLNTFSRLWELFRETPDLITDWFVSEIKMFKWCCKAVAFKNIVYLKGNSAGYLAKLSYKQYQNYYIFGPILIKVMVDTLFEIILAIAKTLAISQKRLAHELWTVMGVTSSPSKLRRQTKQIAKYIFVSVDPFHITHQRRVMHVFINKLGHQWSIRLRGAKVYSFNSSGLLLFLIFVTNFNIFCIK